MSWIYAFPTWEFELAVTLAFAILACAGHVLVRRFVPYRDLLKHNDVAGFLIAIVGVVYAVLLSFVVVVVWQQFDASDLNVQREANQVADLYRLAPGLGAPGRALRSQARRYVELMIHDEWPQMRHGGKSVSAELLAFTMSGTVLAVQPHSASQTNAQAESLNALHAFFDARRERLHDNETGIPGLLWWTLLFGAAVTIGFTYVFGVEDFLVQLVMTAAIAALIGTMLVLVAELDYPFRGDTSISTHSWMLIGSQLVH